MVAVVLVICIIAVVLRSNNNDNDGYIMNEYKAYQNESAEQTDKSALDKIKKQTKNAIADAAGDDVLIMRDDNGITSKVAQYKIYGDGSVCNIYPAEDTDASYEFADYLKKALPNHLETSSKKNAKLRTVTVTIKGNVSDGFTVAAEFTE